MSKFRSAVALTASLSLLFSASSCGGDEGGGGGSGSANSKMPADDKRYEQREHWGDAGDTLTVALIGDADGLLPMVGQSVNGSMVYDLLVPQITNSDFKDGRIIFNPGLAKRYEWNEDKTQLTYYLRDDCYWDDKSGKVVTAEDVRYNYELIGDPDVKSPRQAHLERMRAEKPVEVLDDFTVRFNFLYPYNQQTMLAHAGFNISPKHLLENEARKTLISCSLHKQKAVGHGPFRFLEWKPKQSVTIVRNKYCRNYPVPYLRRIVFKVITEYQTRLTELKKGAVDMIDGIQEKDIADAKSWGNVKLYERGYRFLDYVAWNIKNPLFAEAKARRALTMAIDIDGIIKSLLEFDGKVYGTKAYSSLTPELKDFVLDDFKFLPHDPEKAKAMLGELGWKDTDGDGWLDKDGKPFRFTLLTNSGNPRRADACVLIQSDLKKIGIDCKLDQNEGVTFFDRLKKKDYEAALAGWSAGLFPDPSDIWGTPTETENRVFNFTSDSNKRVDELLEKGLKTGDLAVESACWKELQ